MNPVDPDILYLLIVIGFTVFAVGFARVYRGFTQTQEQRLQVEAQRLMLSFCERPSRARYDAAWGFIEDNRIKLGELDWPLVQRFARTTTLAGF